MRERVDRYLMDVRLSAIRHIDVSNLFISSFLNLNFKFFFISFRKMPRELKGIKEWLERAKQNDARSVTIKRNPHDIKFKVRCSRFLYTLVLKNVDTLKADRLKLSLPPNLQVKEVKCRKSKIPSQ